MCREGKQAPAVGERLSASAPGLHGIKQQSNGCRWLRGWKQRVQRQGGAERLIAGRCSVEMHTCCVCAHLHPRMLPLPLALNSRRVYCMDSEVFRAAGNSDLFVDASRGLQNIQNACVSFEKLNLLTKTKCYAFLMFTEQLLVRSAGVLTSNQMAGSAAGSAGCDSWLPLWLPPVPAVTGEHRGPWLPSLCCTSCSASRKSLSPSAALSCSRAQAPTSGSAHESAPCAGKAALTASTAASAETPSPACTAAAAEAVTAD